MGLDVYLERSDDFAKVDELERRYSDGSEAIWEEVAPGKKYEELTAAERAAARERCDALAAELGLGKLGEHPGRVKVEHDSALGPDHAGHMFKVGYFRSSYNEGGINSVLAQYGVPDLYAIFEPNDRCKFAPDWAAARERCAGALAALADTDTRYSAMAISSTPLADGGVESAEQALDAFRKEMENQPPFDGGWWSKNGNFWPKGVKIFALIPGKRLRPCVWAIVENEGGLAWYRQALEIVAETIDFVLAQPDPQNYRLVWSA